MRLKSSYLDHFFVKIRHIGEDNNDKQIMFMRVSNHFRMVKHECLLNRYDKNIICYKTIKAICLNGPQQDILRFHTD